MLLKVNKAGSEAPPSTAFKRGVRRLFPASKTRGYAIEVNAFLDVLVKSPETSDFLLPRFYGFANTNMGIAFIYEKICDPEGGVAPTLFQLMEEGRVEDCHRVALNALCQRLRSEHLVVNDLHTKNIVYARGQFFLIDGLGDKNLIKIRTAFRFFNDRSQARKCARMVRDFDGLDWDVEAWQYVWAA